MMFIRLHISRIYTTLNLRRGMQHVSPSSVLRMR